MLLVHHANKASFAAGATTTQAASRGSSALVDGVRWVMQFTELPAKRGKDMGISESELNKYLMASVVKSNYSVRPDPLVLHRGEGGVVTSLLPVSSMTNPPEDLERKIAERLESEAGAGRTFSTTKFCSNFSGENGGLGAGDKKLREAVKRMLDKGSLKKDGNDHLVRTQLVAVDKVVLENMPAQQSLDSKLAATMGQGLTGAELERDLLRNAT